MDIVSATAAVGYSTYAAAVTVGQGVNNYMTNSGSSENSIHVNRYYDPLLTLFELAMIPLEDHNYRHNMRLYFDKVITRCPNTAWNQTARTLSRVKSVQYKRTQTKALVRVVLRALDWYDISRDDKFHKSIRYIFEKAIEGLEIYQETYIQGNDPETQKTLRYIGSSIKYLRCALEGKELKEIKDKIKKQTEREKKKEIEFEDSRDFWVLTSTESNEPDKCFDMLSTKVDELRQLYEMKEIKKMDHSQKIKESYEVQKTNLDKYLKGRQQQFINNYVKKV